MGVLEEQIHVWLPSALDREEWFVLPLNCWENNLVYAMDSRLDRPLSLDAVEQRNSLTSAQIEPRFVGVAALTWSTYWSSYIPT